MDEKEFLKSNVLFASLEDAELDLIVNIAKEKTSVTNEIVFEEGVPGDTLYLITEGSVRITQRVTKKREALSFLKKGDFFGEMALFGDEPRSATVIAIENTKFLTIEKSDFILFLDSHPEIGVKILKSMVKIMSDRLRLTDRQVRRNLILSRGYIWSSPVVIKGIIYIGSDDHCVYAIDAAEGTVIWKIETGNIFNVSFVFLGHY